MTSVSDPRHAAFEKVAREVLEPVRRYLARRTDATTAADVLSEVLLVLWRRFDDVPVDPLPWTYGVARNTLANAERSARRQRRVAGRIAALDPPREAAPEDPGAVETVAAVLAQLPARDAELLRLWAWEDLGPPEIAAVLGISANAASIRLHRAREKFKGVMRKQQDVAGHEQDDEGTGDDR